MSNNSDRIEGLSGDEGFDTHEKKWYQEDPPYFNAETYLGIPPHIHGQLVTQLFDAGFLMFTGDNYKNGTFPNRLTRHVCAGQSYRGKHVWVTQCEAGQYGDRARWFIQTHTQTFDREKPGEIQWDDCMPIAEFYSFPHCVEAAIAFENIYKQDVKNNRQRAKKKKKKKRKK